VVRNLSGEVETILGSVKVTVRLRSGTELLTVFFTSKRLILSHIGKRGFGELPGMSMLGKWGAGLESLVKGPGESRRKKKVERGVVDVSPEEILKADKDNFDIAYNEVVKVELDNSSRLGSIMLLTRDDKFEFFTAQDLGAISQLLQSVLGNKVDASRA
jgi:hypothetical protein